MPGGIFDTLGVSRASHGRLQCIISSLRAFRRARDGEAQGRVDWKRNGWPDAKFEVTSAKCDLRNEQQREKREESRERREKTEESREG